MHLAAGVGPHTCAPESKLKGYRFAIRHYELGSLEWNVQKLTASACLVEFPILTLELFALEKNIFAVSCPWKARSAYHSQA